MKIIMQYQNHINVVLENIIHCRTFTCFSTEKS